MMPCDTRNIGETVPNTGLSGVARAMEAGHTKEGACIRGEERGTRGCEAARLAGARNSAMIHTGDILKFESVALPGVGVLRTIDLAGEHFERTHPQRAVIIQFAIDDHRQAGL